VSWCGILGPMPPAEPASEPVKRAKPPAAPASRPHKQLRAAYVARIVSLRELRHVVQQRVGPGDSAVAWLAGEQLGLVTTLQLQTAGVTRGSIESRRGRGLLHGVFRGVHLVGHKVLLPGALELAAVLACGGRALVSHHSAAALYGLPVAPADEVQVTVVARHCRSRPRLQVHRVEELDPRDRHYERGIPLTSPARTLIDLASEASPDELERALAEAYALRLVTEAGVIDAIGRAQNRAGVATLRAELGREAGPALTDSEAERMLLRLIRAGDLPPPLTQVRVAGYRVDLLWPRQRLIVEIDGFRYHGHRAAFERDRRKDAALVAAGYRGIRVTARQIIEAARGCGFHLEEFAWIPRGPFLLQFGRTWPSWLTPARPVKLVLTRSNREQNRLMESWRRNAEQLP